MGVYVRDKSIIWISYGMVSRYLWNISCVNDKDAVLIFGWKLTSSAFPISASMYTSISLSTLLISPNTETDQGSNHSFCISKSGLPKESLLTLKSFARNLRSAFLGTGKITRNILPLFLSIRKRFLPGIPGTSSWNTAACSHVNTAGCAWYV